MHDYFLCHIHHLHRYNVKKYIDRLENIQIILQSYKTLNKFVLNFAPFFFTFIQYFLTLYDNEIIIYFLIIM